MTLPAIMILLGSLLVYGAVQNLSVWALARGDNTQPKPPRVAAGSARSAG